jgi:uncharacterized protein YijF (DUF1287 family)
MSRVRKPAKSKRETQNRAPGTASRAPSRRSRATPARSRAAVSANAYASDDRNSLLLLLAPFLVMTLAVAATQSFTPGGSAWRELALLPEPHTISGASPPPELSPAPPEAAKLITTPALVRPAPVTEVAYLITSGADLRPAPPGDVMVARTEQTALADKCVAPSPGGKPVQSTPVAARSPAAFGSMLAIAARAQTNDLVVYSDKYRQIAFPMGDIPPLYGVCTDVVVRAYRALGIDLQVLVHKSRLGTGDTSIDHRRTSTLRRFFERKGVSLPVSDFVEDYRPGDIVTYHRESGRTSQSHIAIVSDVIALSGRPMIVHNRGWGPQLEDALFANKVTGHYRFMSAPAGEEASSPRAPPAAGRRAETAAPASNDLQLNASAAP